MEITKIHEYPYGVCSVFYLFSERAFIQEKYNKLGARKIKIKKLELGGSTLLVDSSREVPVNDNTPSVLKKFVGEWNRVRQKEDWVKSGESWFSNFKVEISGVPVRIKGEMQIRPTETGCQNRVAIEVSTSVPFIGGTLCQFIGHNIEQVVDQEFHIILNHLDEEKAEKLEKQDLELM